MTPRYSFLLVLAATFAACADSNIAPENSECTNLGEERCTASLLEECQDIDGSFRWADIENCADQVTISCDNEFRPYSCSLPLGCTPCPPGAEICSANEIDVYQCNDDGTITCEPIATCSVELNEVCVSGDGTVECRNACEVSVQNRSYVGCEYYAVDLDNANVGETLNAAAQQYAIAVSNPSPSLTATVVVEQNDALPGEPPLLTTIAGPVLVSPLELEVIELLPREVDGSPPGEFDTGTHTAITSNAYRVTTSAPIIAYQFNPLANFGVFSNDASLLIPSTALPSAGKGSGTSYLVIGWPQTIADTDNPSTDFNAHLRSFLTIVGTAENTTVEVDLSTDIVGSPEVMAITAGSIVEVVLGPFDVLNLETGGFNADFTGTGIFSDLPVVVFSGNEASDVPHFPGLEQRQCCADHLEEQLSPTHTLGTTFVAVRSPSRTCALEKAGADLRCEEQEYDVFRFVGTGEFPEVQTSLPPPFDNFDLGGGVPTDVDAFEDFWIQASSAIEVGQFVTSQWVVCGPGNSDQPCGDPAFILLPPIEQYRTNYVFLVPDFYAFDYVMIAAPADADVRLDGQPIDDFDYCTRRPILTPLPAQGEGNQPIDYNTITCALSDPTVIPGPPAKIEPGSQNDGVHRVTADAPVGLTVYGFDAFVSYGYLAGTNLLPINLK